ncbi:hypothetical protein [Fictibacillus gelatini]|uniref:hypothetical protein n=1 Tax=Fictibacillus gelatini TaxID=225985 RepID=UPI00047E9DA2|nr:hypothetical protein [Fictibacillus gelatini]
MRVNVNDVMTIDKDDNVVQRAAGVDLNTIDVSKIRVSLDDLASLYMQAEWYKTPEAAAKYVKMKNRVLAFFNNAQRGSKNEV